MNFDKIVYWLKQQHNVDLPDTSNIINPTLLPFYLVNNGNGTVIGKWTYEFPQPTVEELDLITNEMITQFKVDKLKDRFVEVNTNLYRTDPKFKLVEMAIETICKQYLNLTNEQYQAFMLDVYNRWAELN
jgi:hypothetical protein